ncbi:hypothetical protein [Puia sp.]|jgi:hypothetical protein|uniref:hypothetical protein n=1 Tax=Puia sp. TaxID=2045100 RepID=UPI002F413AA2
MRPLLIMLLFTTACRPDTHNTGNPILSAVDSFTKKDLRAYGAILFVPSQGCSGCISGIEDFLLNDYVLNGKKGLLFIVTGHTSKKTARNRLGELALNNPDVFFDYTHQFDKPPFMQEYPKVIFLRNGEVESIADINPGTSGDLYKKLVTKEKL